MIEVFGAKVQNVCKVKPFLSNRKNFSAKIQNDETETAQSNSTLFTVGVTPSNLMVTRKLTKSL